jgi:hypothetical protein
LDVVACTCYPSEWEVLKVKERPRMDRREDGAYASTGFIVVKWPEEGSQQKSWRPPLLIPWGR